MGKREGIMEHVSGKEGGGYRTCKWERVRGLCSM